MFRIYTKQINKLTGKCIGTGCSIETYYTIEQASKYKKDFEFEDSITKQYVYTIMEENSSKKEEKHISCETRWERRRLVEDIIFDSRINASEVLDALKETCDNYGVASIADFYKLCSIDTEPDEVSELSKYGWCMRDLKRARIEGCNCHCIIILPVAEYLY